MNRTELIGSMYAARSELLRVIIASAQATVDPDKLHELVRSRDAFTWTINALIDAELLASVGSIDDTCKKVDQATSSLRKLTDIANDIDKAIGYGKAALDAVTGLLRAFPE